MMIIIIIFTILLRTTCMPRSSYHVRVMLTVTLLQCGPWHSGWQAGDTQAGNHFDEGHNHDYQQSPLCIFCLLRHIGARRPMPVVCINCILSCIFFAYFKFY